MSQEPEFVKTSCDQLWEFSPDRNEIAKGHLTATLANKGEVLQSVISNPVYDCTNREEVMWY